jgi:hypothetical protein
MESKPLLISGPEATHLLFAQDLYYRQTCARELSSEVDEMHGFQSVGQNDHQLLILCSDGGEVSLYQIPPGQSYATYQMLSRCNTRFYEKAGDMGHRLAHLLGLNAYHDLTLGRGRMLEPETERNDFEEFRNTWQWQETAKRYKLDNEPLWWYGSWDAFILKRSRVTGTYMTLPEEIAPAKYINMVYANPLGSCSLTE